MVLQAIMGLTAGTAASLGGTASRAWVISAVLHGTVAAAIVVHAEAPRGPVAMQLVDVQTLPVDAPSAPAHPEVPAPVPPPPSVVTPEPPATHPVRAVMVSHAPVPAPTPFAHSEVAAEGVQPALVSTSSAPPTFVMALPVGSYASAKNAPPVSEVVDEKSVSARAEVAYGPAPVYPTEARVAQIEVDVPVEIVVSAAGSVLDAHATRHVGYGLEDAAIDGIRHYRFKPAQRDGHPVAVRMLWTMQFRLQ